MGIGKQVLSNFIARCSYFIFTLTTLIPFSAIALDNPIQRQWRFFFFGLSGLFQGPFGDELRWNRVGAEWMACKRIVRNRSKILKNCFYAIIRVDWWRNIAAWKLSRILRQGFDWVGYITFSRSHFSNSARSSSSLSWFYQFSFFVTVDWVFLSLKRR